jgi:hypothetical protein
MPAKTTEHCWTVRELLAFSYDAAALSVNEVTRTSFAGIATCDRLIVLVITVSSGAVLPETTTGYLRMNRGVLICMTKDEDYA